METYQLLVFTDDDSSTQQTNQNASVVS